MRRLDRHAPGLGITALLALGACGSPPSAGGRAVASAAPRPAVAGGIPSAYAYPAPVKGRYEEVNTGRFDLTDGLAYAKGGHTVVYVTEKPMASPVLVTASCPMTQARALTLLRNSGFLEVALDAKARSNYLAAGTPYGGQSREEGGRWRVTGGNVSEGRIAGRMDYRGHGQFSFDLPVSRPAVQEVTEGERVHGGSTPESGRTLTQAELTAAYTEVRRAARAHDLEGLLGSQGFTPAQIGAIRGLPGIDADLAAHAGHFLEPGVPEEFYPDAGRVGAKGKDPKGAAFFNFYQFTPCGEKLVLVAIGENPQ